MRSSTHSFDPSRLLARAFPTTRFFGGKKHSSKQSEEEHPLDDSPGDFELIGTDDVPPLPEDPIGESSVTTPPHPSPSRAKSTVFRLKNISRASIHLSSFTDSRASSSRTRTATNESDLCLAFPKPPTHIPTPEASVPGASITSDTPPQLPDSSVLDASTSSSAKYDTSSADCAVLADLLADHDVSEREPHPEHPLLPARLAQHPSKHPKRRHRFTGSLKRFKSLSQTLLDSFVSHPIDASSVDTIRSKKRWNYWRDFDSTTTDPVNPPFPSVSPIPELPISFARRSQSSIARDDENNSPPASIYSLPEESPTPIPVPPPRKRKHSAPASLGSPVAHYQVVNPSELTASPSSLVRSTLVHSSARSSVLLPSPSWLNRNVTHLDPSELSATFPPSRISALSDYHLKFPEITAFYPSALFAPNSPRPLPIPPPLIPVPPPQPRQPTSSPVRPVLQPLRTNVYPESPDSDTESFVTSPTPLDSTLYSPASSTTPTTVFASALPSPSPQFRRRPSNISQISVERHRQSIARLKKSRPSSPRTYRPPSCKASRTSLNTRYKVSIPITCTLSY